MPDITSLLLLIDIDGTLLSTNKVAINCMISAAEEVSPQKISFEINDYLGQMDPQIIERLLLKGGTEISQLPNLKENVYKRYLDLLQATLRKEHLTIYEGVREFLDYIQKKRIHYMLLTGNGKKGAEIKLAKANLKKYFSYGAYGDEAANRSELVKYAIEKYQRSNTAAFLKHNIWVIGDSVNDIKCARDNDIKVCIVKTGHADQQQLRSLQPDLFPQNLADPEAIIRSMLTDI